MANIKPMRDYSEHEVLNLFTVSGAHVPMNKGTIVVINSGWYSDRGSALPVGNAGATYPNTVNSRYVVPCTVVPVSTTGAITDTNTAIGITLLDVREVDENGEKMIFHPQHQWERNAVLSGQAVPILTRGVVLYSGIDPNSNPVGGTKLYVTGDSTAGGGLYGLTTVVAGNPVGTALGQKDSRGYCLVKFQFPA